MGSSTKSNGSRCSRFYIKRSAVLRGHIDSVICLASSGGSSSSSSAAAAAAPDLHYLASGSEDGVVCIHTLPLMQLTARCKLSDEDAVAAVVFAPTRRSSSSHRNSSSNSGGCCKAADSCGTHSNFLILFAAVGRQLLQVRYCYEPHRFDNSSSSSSGGSGSSDGDAAVGNNLHHHHHHQQQQQQHQEQQEQQPHSQPEALYNRHTSTYQTPAAAAAAANAETVPLEQPTASTFAGQLNERPLQTAAVAAAVGAPLHAASLQVVFRQEAAADDISALAVNLSGSYLAAADDAGDVTLFDLSKWQQQQQQRQQQDAVALPVLRLIKAAHHPLAAAVLFRPHKPWQLLTAGMDCRVACWDFSRSNKCLAAWNMADIPSGMSHPGHACTDGVGGAGQAAADAGRQLWNPPMVHAMAVPCERQLQHDSASNSSNAQLAPPALLKRVLAAACGHGGIIVFDAEGEAKVPAVAHGSARSKKSSSKSAGAAAAAAAAAAPLQIPAGFSLCLDAAADGHKVPAAAVVFLPFQGGARLLLSGGEDGQLLLWDWQAAAVAAVKHGDEAADDRQPCQEQPEPPVVPPRHSATVAYQGEATPCTADLMGSMCQQLQYPVSCPVAVAQHGKKINAISCLPSRHHTASTACIAVADTSSRITVYTISDC